MILLTATDLYKSHGMKVIFDQISLSINSGDKIGLIGINGTGKTSLLRILAGVEEPDRGEVLTSNQLVIEYLPQNPEFDPEATVLQQIFRGESPFMKVLRGYEQVLMDLQQDPNNSQLTQQLLELSNQMDVHNAWQLESEAKSILNKLGIHDFNAPLKTLSGGQKKRIALAGVLIRPCNLLILDEPTNHLDNDTISYLEGILKNKHCGLLMVTHDRYFLDRVTNRIVEIERSKLYNYEGNYATFLELKAGRQEMEDRMREKERSLYQQELEWMRKGVEARRTKQKARIQRFEQLESTLSSLSKDKLELSFGHGRLGKKIIEMEHLHQSFGDKVCIDDLSYVVVRDDRIGIVGNNGLGKSTLLNIIAGAITSDSGRLEIGETVRMGYYTQDNYDLQEDKKVIDYIKEKGEYIYSGDGTMISAARMLERFLFPATLQYSLIAKLSGGEKRRLYLLGILMQDVNVLLLDEPTNDLDIQTLQILEDFIDHFPGPVLAVSHDRYFLDKIAQRIFAFEGNGMVEIYTGNYSDYAEKAEGKRVAYVEQKESKEKKQWNKPKEEKVKFSYKEAKEYETIEDDIAQLEQAIATIEADMISFATDFGKLSDLIKEKETREIQLMEKMERWEYLMHIAEQMEKA